MSLIGICGIKRSGKDTAADYLVNKYNYNKIFFSEPIKDAICAMLGVTMQEIENFGRETPIPWLDGCTYRELWQTLGTEWGRHMISPNIWLSIAERKAKNFNNVVISDVRFDNEAKMILDNKGIIIQILRDTTAYDKHESEKGVSHHLITTTLYNNCSRVNLYNNLDSILNDKTLNLR